MYVIFTKFPYCNEIKVGSKKIINFVSKTAQQATASKNNNKIQR